jgi:SAM-dependent methyltransferase
MARQAFNSLLNADPSTEPVFKYIDPPFNFNAPTVLEYPQEVSGFFLLNSLCRRMGWSSLKGRKLLDFGCGVRFARTIVNLGIDIGLYAGVDVNAEAIQWLRSNIEDSRFRFERLDMRNRLYHLDGAAVDVGALKDIGLVNFDAACMFSVITHQKPDDAQRIFSLLWECVVPKGGLYFTAFTDEAIDEYIERDPDQVCLLSTYNPDYLIDLLEESGWLVEKIYPLSKFQQTAFVCQKKE